MIKRLQQHIDSKALRIRKDIEHTINASHELNIMQHIGVPQLKKLEQTYTYMLEAIKEARRDLEKKQKRTAEIIEHGEDRAISLRREHLKIACLWRRGIKSKEIDKAMILKRGYTMNRAAASNGTAIKNELLREAKKRMVIKLVNDGHGIRPTARAIPAALGKCSPALVIKIMKSEKLRQQTQLPFPLRSV